MISGQLRLKSHFIGAGEPPTQAREERLGTDPSPPLPRETVDLVTPPFERERVVDASSRLR
jgi:hypothetical protein